MLHYWSLMRFWIFIFTVSSSSHSSSSGSSQSSSSRSRSSSSSRSSSASNRSRGRKERRSASPKRRKLSPTKPAKIHVARLTRNVTKEHVVEIFSSYGIIKNIDVVIHIQVVCIHSIHYECLAHWQNSSPSFPWIRIHRIWKSWRRRKSNQIYGWRANWWPRNKHHTCAYTKAY